mmetsp:Transcript_5236/g.22263  ORF Transcript_5236/g.22263 Transcript_5236/m.22263 type:complete len:270 (+) Transcript_5236:219-1028(+)
MCSAEEAQLAARRSAGLWRPTRRLLPESRECGPLAVWGRRAAPPIHGMATRALQPRQGPVQRGCGPQKASELLRVAWRRARAQGPPRLASLHQGAQCLPKLGSLRNRAAPSSPRTCRLGPQPARAGRWLHIRERGVERCRGRRAAFLAPTPPKRCSSAPAMQRPAETLPPQRRLARRTQRSRRLSPCGASPCDPQPPVTAPSRTQLHAAVPPATAWVRAPLLVGKLRSSREGSCPSGGSAARQSPCLRKASPGWSSTGQPPAPRRQIRG